MKTAKARAEPDASETERLSAMDGVQAVRRAMTVLRYVARGRGQGERLRDIAEQANLKIPTARRILKSLIEDRMVLQVEGRRYVIGPLAAELGLAYRGHAGAVGRWRPLLNALGKITGDTIYLIGRGGFDSVVLDRIDGTSHIRATPFEVGQRHALGIGTGSLAILASLDDQEVDLVLASNDKEYRLHDGLDAGRVRSMVERTRKFGYAMTLRTTLTPGMTGFSVALPPADGQVLLAVSIASVGNEIPQERRQSLKQLLLREIGKMRS